VKSSDVVQFGGQKLLRYIGALSDILNRPPYIEIGEEKEKEKEKEKEVKESPPSSSFLVPWKFDTVPKVNCHSSLLLSFPSFLSFFYSSFSSSSSSSYTSPLPPSYSFPPSLPPSSSSITATTSSSSSIVGFLGEYRESEGLSLMAGQGASSRSLESRGASSSSSYSSSSTAPPPPPPLFVTCSFSHLLPIGVV